jgi:lipopolysaccharide export system ATP-binding protein
MYRRARDGHMGYLAQEASVFRKLSVEQNISSMLELLGVDRKTRRRRTQELLEQFDIVKIRRSKAAKLSGGERRRLEIARCLITNPQIIMLDEPYAGIDPVTVQSIRGTINRLRETGIAILITDHAAMEILRTVDRCYVINSGKVLFEGTPEEVKMHKQVQKQYLGDMEGDLPATPHPDSKLKAPHWLHRPTSNSQTSTSWTATPPASSSNKTTLRRRTDV